MDNQWHHIIMRFVHDKYDVDYEHADKIVGADAGIHYLAAREVLFLLINHDFMDLFRFHRMYISPQQETKGFKAVNHLKLKFMCTPRHFGILKKAYLKNPHRKQLRKQGFLIWEEIEESTDSNEHPGSDNDMNWHPFVKDAWPYYIQGVSMAWMKMVDRAYLKVMQEHYFPYNLDPEDVEGNLAVYQLVRAYMKTIWQSNAAHAFFHHAAGVFGYNWVSVRWPWEDYILESMGFTFEGGGPVYGKVRF